MIIFQRKVCCSAYCSHSFYYCHNISTFLRYTIHFKKRNQDNYLLSLCLLLYMKNEFCLVGKSSPSVSHKSPDFDQECSMFVSGNTECMYIGLQAVQQNWFHYGSLNCSFFQIPNLKNRRMIIIIFVFFFNLKKNVFD